MFVDILTIMLGAIEEIIKTCSLAIAAIIVWLVILSRRLVLIAELVQVALLNYAGF